MIDTFNFFQHVSGPTQEQGHTLDLVLSYGLPILNIQTQDAVFSGHMPVLFDFNLSCLKSKSNTPAHLGRVFKPTTAAQFSCLFQKSSQFDTGLVADTEKLTSSFLSTCASILDIVSPLKVLRPRPKSEPGFNDTTRAARESAGEQSVGGRKTSFMSFMKF